MSLTSTIRNSVSFVLEKFSNPLTISEFKFSQSAELDISIIIVSFNTREILLRCLESIQKQTGQISYEVIVVDNASEDGTVEAVTERFRNVEVIFKNHGLNIYKNLENI